MESVCPCWNVEVVGRERHQKGRCLVYAVLCDLYPYHIRSVHIFDCEGDDVERDFNKLRLGRNCDGI